MPAEPVQNGFGFNGTLSGPQHLPQDAPTGPLPPPVNHEPGGGYPAMQARPPEAMPLGAPTPAPPFDPESTAAWSLHEEEQEGHAAPAPAWSAPENAQQEPAPGPIVPDDWFVDAHPAAPPYDGAATAQYGPNPQQPGPMYGDPQGAPMYGDAQGAPMYGDPQTGPMPGPQAQDPWGPQQPAANHQQGPDAWNEGGPNATMVMGGPATQAGPMPPGGPAPGMPMGGPGEYMQAPGPGFPPPNGPYGNDFPHNGGQSSGKRQNKTLLMVVGGLVAAALVAVGFVMLSGGGGGSPSSTTSPVAEHSKGQSGPKGGHEEATAVNAILDQSLRSRSQLNDALSEAKKCNGLDSAINTMQQVASDRQAQIDKTNSLTVDKLQNGSQLRDALSKAITASLNVDKAFLSWAQSSRGCHGHTKSNADERHGQQLSDDATNAKRDFARLWDPVAAKEGFNKRGTYF